MLALRGAKPGKVREMCAWNYGAIALQAALAREQL
jgi:hypothetical protein